MKSITYGINYLTDLKVYDNLYKHYPRGKNEMYKWVRNGNCKFAIVARDGDQIIGSLGIKQLDDKMYRYLHLVVHPKYQMKGIGTTILRKAPDMLKAMGAIHIENHKRQNVIRHEIFTELGFELTDVRDEKGDEYFTYVWEKS